MKIQRWAASVTAATVIVGGGLTAAAVGLPNLVGAQEETTTTTVEQAPAPDGDLGGLLDGVFGGHQGPLRGVLDGLVADGTLTQDQADAVLDGVSAELDERGQVWAGHLGEARDEALAALAGALDMAPEEAAAALEGGATVGELIEQQGLDRPAVVDELAAAVTARLDQAVADGDVPGEWATRIEEHAADLVERVVDEELPWGLLRWMGGGHGGGPLGGLLGPGR